MNTVNMNSESLMEPEHAILVVEDKRVWQQILQDLSKALVCRTRVASDYSQAIKALYETNFSLAVIDLGLGDENRLGRILIQRMNREFPHIPIIVVTGIIDENQPEFVEIEANPQVIKIFSKQSLRLNELLAYVEEILLKKGKSILPLQSNHPGNRPASLQPSSLTTSVVQEKRASALLLFGGVFLGLLVIGSVWLLLAWVMREFGVTLNFGLILLSLVSSILIMAFALTVFGILGKDQLIGIFNKILDQVFIPDWKRISSSWKAFRKGRRTRHKSGKD